jgi:hypothetical protein
MRTSTIFFCNALSQGNFGFIYAKGVELHILFQAGMELLEIGGVL